MTTKAIYSKEWISLQEADHEFVVIKHNFRKTIDFLEQILSILNYDKELLMKMVYFNNRLH